MAETYDAKIFQRDGVAMVLYPDGDEAVLADVMRYMNPGMEYDQATGEALYAAPPPAEAGADWKPAQPYDMPSSGLLASQPEDQGSATGFPELDRMLTGLGNINQMLNPVEGIGQSMDASRRMLAPDTAGWDRVSALGDMLSGVAGVAAPVAAAARAGTPAAMALMEGLLGWSPTSAAAKDTAKSIARTVAERANQRGPVPTMGSNFGNVFGDGWSDVYHWSRSPDDFTAFDPNKSTSAMSQLGPHVGTKEAADARYMGYADAKGNPSPLGFTMPLKADLSKPFVNPSTGQPWSEMDLEMFVSAVADENGVDRRVVAPLMRDRLAQEGYTSIPYVNDVEDPGNISSIMLTDRPSGSDAVLRSRFAKFDPAMRNLKNLSAGVAISPLAYGLLSDQYARENRQ